MQNYIYFDRGLCIAERKSSSKISTVEIKGDAASNGMEVKYEHNLQYEKLRYQVITSFDFCLWGYLKLCVYKANGLFLPLLKNIIFSSRCVLKTFVKITASYQS